jgi:hypothetical protein
MTTSKHPDYLALDDDALLRQCHVDTYKASGPGGQHRNKVSSAVRLRHDPTGIDAHADDSRSQHSNKRSALKRLRMNIACQLRHPVDLMGGIPEPIVPCLVQPKNAPDAKRRLMIGKKDYRYWQVAGAVLDVLDTCEGQLSKSADFLGVSTGNLSRFLTDERHLLTSAQAIRHQYGLKPLK